MILVWVGLKIFFWGWIDLQKIEGGTWILGRCTCLETQYVLENPIGNGWTCDLWFFPWMFNPPISSVSFVMGGGEALPLKLRQKSNAYHKDSKKNHVTMTMWGATRGWWWWDCQGIQDLRIWFVKNCWKSRVIRQFVFEKRESWPGICKLNHVDNYWCIYIYILYTYGPQNRWVVHVIAMLHVWKSSQQW